MKRAERTKVVEIDFAAKVSEYAERRAREMGPRYVATPLVNVMSEYEVRYLFWQLMRQARKNERAPEKRLVKLREAAVYTRMSAKVLRRLVQDGELRAIRRNGGGSTTPWLLSIDDLDRWAERNLERL